MAREWVTLYGPVERFFGAGAGLGVRALMQARRGRRADALGGEVPSGAAAACCVLRGAGAAITLLYGVSDGIHDEHKARLAFLKNSPGEASADQDPSVPGPSRTRRRAVLHLAYKYGASDARGARGAEAAQTGPERSNGEAERSNWRVRGARAEGWLMHHGGSSSASTVRRRPQRSPERLQTHPWAPAITPIVCGSRWRRQRG